MLADRPDRTPVLGHAREIELAPVAQRVAIDGLAAAERDGEVAAHGLAGSPNGRRLAVAVHLAPRAVVRARVVFDDGQDAVGGQRRERLHLAARVAEVALAVVLRRHDVVHHVRPGEQRFQRVVRAHLRSAVGVERCRVAVVGAHDLVAAQRGQRLLGAAAHGQHVLGGVARIEVHEGNGGEMPPGVPDDRSVVERAPRGGARHRRVGERRIELGRKRLELLLRRLGEVEDVARLRTPSQPFDRMSGIYAIADDAVGVGRGLQIADGPGDRLLHLVDGALRREGEVHAAAVLGDDAPLVAAHVVGIGGFPVARRTDREIPDEPGVLLRAPVQLRLPVERGGVPHAHARMPFARIVIDRDGVHRQAANRRLTVHALGRLRRPPEEHRRLAVDMQFRAAVQHLHLRHRRMVKARDGGGREYLDLRRREDAADDREGSRFKRQLVVAATAIERRDERHDQFPRAVCAGYDMVARVEREAFASRVELPLAQRDDHFERAFRRNAFERIAQHRFAAGDNRVRVGSAAEATLRARIVAILQHNRPGRGGRRRLANGRLAGGVPERLVGADAFVGTIGIAHEQFRQRSARTSGRCRVGDGQFVRPGLQQLDDALPRGLREIGRLGYVMRLERISSVQVEIRLLIAKALQPGLYGSGLQRKLPRQRERAALADIGWRRDRRTREIRPAHRRDRRAAIFGPDAAHRGPGRLAVAVAGRQLLGCCPRTRRRRRNGLRRLEP